MALSDRKNNHATPLANSSPLHRSVNLDTPRGSNSEVITIAAEVESDAEENHDQNEPKIATVTNWYSGGLIHAPRLLKDWPVFFAFASFSVSLFMSPRFSFSPFQAKFTRRR
jgi:hypothetical protein